MKTSDPKTWPVGWSEHRREQMRVALQASAEQRLAWLEEALQLAAASGALDRRREKDSESVEAGDGL